MGGINQVFVGIGRVAVTNDLVGFEGRAVGKHDAGGLTLLDLYLCDALIQFDVNALLDHQFAQRLDQRTGTTARKVHAPAAL